MEEIILYGASDDLIEIEATAFKNEEFNVNCDESCLVAISDGTVLRVRFDQDGIWRFAPVIRGSADLTIVQGTDDDNYTDRVTLTGDDLRWVVLGTEIAK